MKEPKEIGFEDTKLITNEDGDEVEVAVYIPECCREGWDSCPHVVQPIKKRKRNIGL